MSSAPEAKCGNGGLLFTLFSQRAAPGLGKHVKVILVLTRLRGEGSTHSARRYICGGEGQGKTGIKFNEIRLTKC